MWHLGWHSDGQLVAAGVDPLKLSQENKAAKVAVYTRATNRRKAMAAKRAKVAKQKEAPHSRNTTEIKDVPASQVSASGMKALPQFVNITSVELIVEVEVPMESQDESGLASITPDPAQKG